MSFVAALPAFVYVFLLLVVLAVGLVGTTRRIGFWGALLLSIVLTPIGGFLVAVISGPRRIAGAPLALRHANRKK